MQRVGGNGQVRGASSRCRVAGALLTSPLAIPHGGGRRGSEAEVPVGGHTAIWWQHLWIPKAPHLLQSTPPMARSNLGLSLPAATHPPPAWDCSQPSGENSHLPAAGRGQGPLGWLSSQLGCTGAPSPLPALPRSDRGSCVLPC
jgi:hypothetical protein